MQSVRLPYEIVFAAVLLLGGACSPGSPDTSSDTAWVGTITTEGNVTTVVNESGSVWGGTATLAEEISIGVASGEPEYMLGGARTIWDTGERVFYPDLSIPVVRVYDGAGTYLGNVGRAGEGPGEYQYPFSVLTLEDGRIVVSNAGSDWVNLFSPEMDFSYLERWGSFSEQLTAPGGRLFHVLALGNDGTLFIRYYEFDAELLPERHELHHAWRSINREGVGSPMWIPEFDYEYPRRCSDPECRLISSVKYAAIQSSTFTPTADIIAGIGDEYKFEIHHPNGTVTIVRRVADPITLSDEEWTYWMRRERAQGLARNPDWQQSWGDEVPRQKPAFRRLYATRDRKILIVREGPSRRVEPCTADPQPDDRDFEACWESTPIWDYFDSDGRYLGEIAAPAERMRPIPFINGGRFTMAVEDEAGTIMVKRYLLVLPRER